MKIVNDSTIFDGTGNDPFSLPDIPESVTDEIIESSVSEIDERLHEHALVMTDQELREFTGVLDPKGGADIKIEALEQTANEYRLKALREGDQRKEQLYRNIQETAELKTDLIYITEKGEAPKYDEAISIIEEEVTLHYSFLVCDFSTTALKRVQGQGVKLTDTQNGILIEVEKSAGTTACICYLYVLSDGLINLANGQLQSIQY